MPLSATDAILLMFESSGSPSFYLDDLHLLDECNTAVVCRIALLGSHLMTNPIEYSVCLFVGSPHNPQNCCVISRSNLIVEVENGGCYCHK